MPNWSYINSVQILACFIAHCYSFHISRIDWLQLILVRYQFHTLAYSYFKATPNLELCMWGRRTEFFCLSFCSKALFVFCFVSFRHRTFPCSLQPIRPRHYLCAVVLLVRGHEIIFHSPSVSCRFIVQLMGLTFSSIFRLFLPLQKIYNLISMFLWQGRLVAQRTIAPSSQRQKQPWWDVAIVESDFVILLMRKVAFWETVERSGFF